MPTTSPDSDDRCCSLATQPYSTASTRCCPPECSCPMTSSQLRSPWPTAPPNLTKLAARSTSCRPSREPGTQGPAEKPKGIRGSPRRAPSSVSVQRKKLSSVKLSSFGDPPDAEQDTSHFQGDRELCGVISTRGVACKQAKDVCPYHQGNRPGQRKYEQSYVFEE